MTIRLVQWLLSAGCSLQPAKRSRSCHALLQVPELASKSTILQTRASIILGITLAQRLDLFFGQHMANVLACIMYGVCKAHQVQIPLFQHIWQALRHTLPQEDTSVFQRASLISHVAPTQETVMRDARGESLGEPQMKITLGDTRKLYNQCFLPSMEGHLQRVCTGQDDLGLQIVDEKPPRSARRPPLGTLTVHDLNVRRAGPRTGPHA